jgi:hypothetical protein
MATINVGQLVATTLRRRLPKLYDNVTDNVALYNYLKRKGNMTFDSGRDILVPIEYTHPSIQWYSGYQTLNIAPTDIIDAATYDWKQAAVTVSISGEERLKNSGSNGLIKLATSKVRNAEKGFVNGLGAAVYADGTGSGGLEIGGLRALISTTPSSGSVGGIDPSTNAFWENQYFDGSTFLSTAVISTNIRQVMTHLWTLCTRNMDKPDAIFADNNFWELYQNSLQGIQRITNQDAKSGWMEQKFMTADVILDGGQGGNCPADTMFFVNTDYLKYITHEDREMEVIGGTRTSINQDADVQMLLFAGNLVLANRALQGRTQQ